MEGVVSFKERLSAFKVLHDVHKLQSLNLKPLKDAAKEMFDLLLIGSTAIDGLLSSRDELNVMKTYMDEFREVVSRSTDSLKKNYADVLKKNPGKENPLPPAIVKINGVDKTIQNQQTLVVKPKPGLSITSASAMATRDGISKALETVPVSRFRQSESGTMTIQFPNEATKNSASAALSAIINEDSQVILSEPKKLLPKLTVVGVPVSIADDDLINQIVRKNAKIASLVAAGCAFALVFSKEKKVGDQIESKVAVLKVSPEIRSVIMDAGGALYLDLVRCKVYDRFWVTQCFHCQGFGHISASCPKSESPPVCCFCSGSHNGQTCTSKNSPQCANCPLNGDRTSNVSNCHFAFSSKCPQMLIQRQRLVNSTNFACTKN